jgi:hypothetical protein
VGCNCNANAVAYLLSPQNPKGLKSFVDFYGVARSGKTAAGIASQAAPAAMCCPALAPSKISKCSSAVFMGFNQRFPRFVLNHEGHL